MDTDGLASRYRRAAASQGKPNERDSVGPATGRLNRDDAARLASAPTRAGKEIADPAKSSAPKDPSTRLANARTNAAGPSALAPKASTLRERALADPKRTRNFLKNSSPAAGATGSAVSAGLSYGMGWPACGAGVGYGCWDDNWSVWFGCYYGGGYPYYPYGGYYGWGCWPYSLWWWGSYWYPYSYYGYGHGYGYGSYGPTSVVVYQDAYPSTNAPAEEAPAYSESGVGEGVIDDKADPGTRVVDESMERLMSPTAAAASRAATANLGSGDAAFREGRFGDAVHFYARAIEFQPDEGVLYLVLSDALFATGDYHYGAYALRKALELDPKLLDNIVDKHGFYADPKEFDRQLAVLETYLKDRPTDQDARLLLAANYLFGLRPAAAVDLLEASAGESLRASPSGLLLLEAARKQQYGAATASPAK